ncbi:MAG: DRTGG domain-containing protein [Clostridia bacterium]|nr:DRTGG domain-containing protein [Clostridia bacterium]
MTTKHNKILEYIESLKAGTRISVRKVAAKLNVSEGTAYRAIKEAENRKLVSTIQRVGTVRIEKIEKKNIEKLSFGEITNIVDGTVLGGFEGLGKTLNKFLIGAMTVDEAEKYINRGDLLIVGNREECYRLALEKDASVLITGGFGCSDEIKEIANKKKLPIITSSYDTFTIATLINKAIYERLAKKDILLVEDIMAKDPFYLKETDKVEQWKNLFYSTTHTRFPVVDKKNNVVGIITAKDVTEAQNDEMIKNRMTRDLITLDQKTTVAYASYIMIWEGIELIPIVEDGKLIGVISRRDVMKAMQYMRSQPQVGETMEDLLLSNFSITSNSKVVKFTGEVEPAMLNRLGVASWSAIIMLMSTAAVVATKRQRKLEPMPDSFIVYFIKPVQIEDKISLIVNTIDSGRHYCKIEVEVRDRYKTLARGMMSAKIFRR